ncbi:AaceriABR179Cp [[Ashbya] aceris (nom. inval.)]|nr:AaceriABR179Cp [[Ashbya] aceris (nom. inval.)]
MAPPKKNAIKMDLTSFLNDDSFGDSWADDQVDLNNINLPIQNVAASNTIPLEQLGSAAMGKGGHLDSALMGSKRERVEYPVPDAPPYRARISNLPWDVSEEGVHAWTEDMLEKPGCVEKVIAPKDRDSDRLRGWAFVTFAEREDLVRALSLNATKLNDRTVYVAVAAPKDGMFDESSWSGARGANFQASGEDPIDLDWGAVRGSNFHPSERKPRREDPDLDWGMSRGSNFKPSEHKPRREEADVDWSMARGSNFHASERKPRREEPDIDWGVARGSNFQPRERKPRSDEPDLDWGAARGSNFQSAKSRPKRNEPEPNWAAARSAKAAPPATRKASAPALKEDTPRIQKSSYDILNVESDSEHDAETTGQHSQPDDDVAHLEKAAQSLTLEEDGEWEVVGKKQ